MESDIPEYLCLFRPQGEGELTIEVKFGNAKASVVKQSMNYDEFYKLVDHKTGRLIMIMSFDEYVSKIKRYEFDPVKNTMHIVCE